MGRGDVGWIMSCWHLLLSKSGKIMQSLIVYIAKYGSKTIAMVKNSLSDCNQQGGSMTHPPFYQEMCSMKLEGFTILHLPSKEGINSNSLSILSNTIISYGIRQ